MRKKSAIEVVVAIGIGIGLYFGLGMISIPTLIPNTSIAIQYGILALFAVIYGPFAGAIIGLGGHMLIDLSYGYGFWWSWIIASAVFGFLVGLIGKRFSPEDGEFKANRIIGFNLTQVGAHIICWLVIAPVLDILIYSEPANKVFLQGAFAALMNSITTGVIATLLLFAYSKTQVKSGSLKLEDDDKN